jgi:hydrogenase maturation protease
VTTLVLGLGNPILTDDGVGIYAVREAAARWQGHDVAFGEASVGGLRLLDWLQGCRRAVIVDAIQTGSGTPGDVYRLHLDDLRGRRASPPLHAGSTHDLSLPGALALGRRLGMELPDDDEILLLAVEVEDVLSFGEECTPAVAAAIPGVVEMILAEVGLRQPGA